MSDYCGACYCNAKCEKKHLKCFERKLDKYNNKEARKKMIQSDARQAFKDAEKVRDKPAKVGIQNLFLRILKMIFGQINSHHTTLLYPLPYELAKNVQRY